MLAITISRMIAMVISSGFSNVVLYRVSRLDGEAEALLSRRIAGTALSLVVLGSATLAMGVAVLAQPIASVFSKPELAPWLVLLAVLIPLNACKAVLIAWYRARQMVPTSVFFESIVPSILRAILLALAWWVGGGATEIAATLATALLVSVVWLFAIEPLGPSNPLALFTPWDVQYGLKIMGTAMANLWSQGLDILLVGALAPPRR